MKKSAYGILMLLFALIAPCVMANNVALKTNLLYDATLSPNLGVEFPIAPRWSLDLSGNYNGWKITNSKQWKHWFVQPEVRYWTKDLMKGHFVAGHVIGGQYNVALNKSVRRQGDAIGLGVGYGYNWRLNQNWGMEAEIALGYARLSYDTYPCTECGRKLGHVNRNYVGPTKVALNLVYYFGGKKKEPQIIYVPQEPIVETVTVVDTVVIEQPKEVLPTFNFKLLDAPRKKSITQDLAGVARIQFKVNITDIDPAMGQNQQELDDIASTLDSISNNLGMTINRIVLHGYASPEGSYANNERLAKGRTEALKTVLEQRNGIPSNVIVVDYTPEDWDGLRQAIEDSDLANKAKLLAIIDSDRDLDAKERALRQYPVEWRYLVNNVLPNLRRTEYKIEYRHDYEEDEIMILEEVNAAITAGDLEKAAKLLVDIPSSPEADYARGVVAALQHRYDEAEAWFTRAQSRGIPEATEALEELKK